MQTAADTKEKHRNRHINSFKIQHVKGQLLLFNHANSFGYKKTIPGKHTQGPRCNFHSIHGCEKAPTQQPTRENHGGSALEGGAVNFPTLPLYLKKPLLQLTPAPFLTENQRNPKEVTARQTPTPQ